MPNSRHYARTHTSRRGDTHSQPAVTHSTGKSALTGRQSQSIPFTHTHTHRCTPKRASVCVSQCVRVCEFALALVRLCACALDSFREYLPHFNVLLGIQCVVAATGTAVAAAASRSSRSKQAGRQAGRTATTAPKYVVQ